MTLKRPIEIIEGNPGMKKHGWNYATIGHLLNFKLVRGKKLIRGCVVNESDVLKIFRLVLPEAELRD